MQIATKLIALKLCEARLKTFKIMHKMETEIMYMAYTDYELIRKVPFLNALIQTTDAHMYKMPINKMPNGKL